MAGINDNIVFPVIDLIRREIRAQKRGVKLASDPFEGYPHVQLNRDNPTDRYQLTGVDLAYHSGYVVNIDLVFGSEDESTYPDPEYFTYFDYDYYRTKRLTEVIYRTFNDNGVFVGHWVAFLDYGKDGLLNGIETLKVEDVEV